MYSKVESDKTKFLEQAKAARLERQLERNKEESAIKVQVNAQCTHSNVIYYIALNLIHFSLDFYIIK